MAISKNEPLNTFVQRYKESGIDIAVFPTSNGDKFALRVVDPDDPKRGLAHLATFAGTCEEAKMPDGLNAQILKNRELDAMIKDPKKQAKYIACYCVVDEESLKHSTKLTAQDIGKTFISISHPHAVESLSYRELEDSKAEKAVKSVSKAGAKKK